MRTHAWWMVLVPLLLVVPASAEEPAPLGEDAALALLQDAARISPPYMRTLLTLDPAIARRLLQADGADAPLTAAIIALADGRELHIGELAWGKHATPQAFVEAIYPQVPMRTQSKARYAHANVAHPELVRRLTLRSDGDRAYGTLRLGKEHVFECRVRWYAARDAAGHWSIRRFVFESSGVRVVRDGPRWRLDIESMRSRINPRRGRQLALPRIGTVGIEPPAEQTVLISVTSAGTIHLDPEEGALSLTELRMALGRRAAPGHLRQPDGSSNLAALLDIDASTPWTVVQWLMQTLAHPAIRIHKLYFGARATGDGREGAIASRLPKDRSGPARAGPAPERIRVKAFLGSGEPSEPAALYAALLQIPAERRQSALWEIVAAPPLGGNVPHGAMLQTLDAMIAAGATHIMFEGAAPPPTDRVFGDAEALAQSIRERKTRPGHPYVKLGRQRIAHDAPQREIPRGGRVERTVGAVDFGSEDPRHGSVWIEDLEIRDDLPIEAPREKGPLPEGEIRRLRAIARGLRWLAAHQARDGRWEAATFHRWCDGTPVPAPATPPGDAGMAAYDVAVTGHALLAFLHAGNTNRGGHAFAKVVSRGLRSLKNVQTPAGGFGPPDAPDHLLQHAAAAHAMVEAFARTGSPIYKGSAQRALEYSAAARFPNHAVGAALHRALARGHELNEARRRRGRAAPLIVDAKALEATREHRDKALPADPPERGSGIEGIDLWDWRLRMAAAKRVGGRPWASWQQVLHDDLLPIQRVDDDPCALLGSWDPLAPWRKEGGRVHATAMVVLLLLAAEGG